MAPIKHVTVDEPSQRMAIIVAIENYRKGISLVKYAKNDAGRFKDLLINGFGFLPSEILVFEDHAAVKTAFEEDITYSVSQLSPDHQFIFYYVGHGFYKNGHNMLTCWDTSSFNIEETSVSMSDVLLEPLKRSGCKRSLIFLDTCAEDLKGFLDSRDILADMSAKELEEFTKLSEYNAVFMSCSPGEKSYSCDLLKQGIWTHHLAEALSGKTEQAIVKDVIITAGSLQNYLSAAVPEYIARTKVGARMQRPYAKLQAQRDFAIKQFPVPVKQYDASVPDFRLNYQKAVFRKIDRKRIKDSKGWEKRYSIPKWKSDTTTKFIQKAFQPDLEKEIQGVYEEAKTVFGLKKVDLNHDTILEGGYVYCDYFRYDVEVDLDEADLSKARIVRTLKILVSRKDLPAKFNDIFPIYLDELIIPIEGAVDFDDIVNKFENLADAQGGSVTDNQAKETMEYITPNGTSITIDVKKRELILTHYSPQRALDLVDKSIEDLKRISSHKIMLLS